jgi:hypothetical protein
MDGTLVIARRRMSYLTCTAVPSVTDPAHRIMSSLQRQEARVEQFLREDREFQNTLESKDVLVKFYVAKSKFADAANVLIDRSEKRRENESNLETQLDCLTRALIFAQQISVVTRGGLRYGGLKCPVSEIHERIKVR